MIRNPETELHLNKKKKNQVCYSGFTWTNPGQIVKAFALP